MQLIEPSFEILSYTPDAVQMLERAGRTCYKSEDKITCDSAPGFVRRLIDRHHESVIEHASATVRVITDRATANQLVRHRHLSVSQESTRYCNYGKKGVTFIRPLWASGERLDDFKSIAREAEDNYNYLLEKGLKPEEARDVLPHCLKTELVLTGNFRQWRHVFKERTARAAAPEMRLIMQPIAQLFAKKWPCVFADLIAQHNQQ